MRSQVSRAPPRPARMDELSVLSRTVAGQARLNMTEAVKFGGD